MFLFLAILITSRPIVHILFFVTMYGCSCFLFFSTQDRYCAPKVPHFLNYTMFLPQGQLFFMFTHPGFSMYRGEEKLSQRRSFCYQAFSNTHSSFSISLPCIFTSESFFPPPPTLFPSHLFCFVFLSPFRSFLRAPSICTQLFR